jgi:hypothetical protein
MGDRANVQVKDGESSVFLYTHWSGSELPETLKAALIRGKSRWNDGQYLARIIFCEMVKDEINGTTGYGISSVVGDGDDRVILVDVGEQTVRIKGDTVTFEEYVTKDYLW